VRSERKFLGRKTIDNYWNYLDLHATSLKDFGYSGHVFSNLLIYLMEERGIDLLSTRYDAVANSLGERRQNSTIILTFDQRQAFLEKLNADEFDQGELIAFNKDFSDDDDPELAKAEIEGIKFLQYSLGQLTGDHEKSC